MTKRKLILVSMSLLAIFGLAACRRGMSADDCKKAHGEVRQVLQNINGAQMPYQWDHKSYAKDLGLLDFSKYAVGPDTSKMYTYSITEAGPDRFAVEAQGRGPMLGEVWQFELAPAFLPFRLENKVSKCEEK